MHRADGVDFSVGLNLMVVFVVCSHSMHNTRSGRSLGFSAENPGSFDAGFASGGQVLHTGNTNTFLFSSSGFPRQY